jgi:release factor glutamine methyltransferase
MSLLKKILNVFHPILKPLSSWYLSKPRKYKYKGIEIKIPPGVFHPGLFFSTRVLLEYLASKNLREKRLLELGAGTGLISIYCAQKGAHVSASDISQRALQTIKENAQRNAATLVVIESDLFDSIDPRDFDLIVINPPYYPRTILSEADRSWFCGEHFEYFEKLFNQLRGKPSHLEVLMILSEDCALHRIQSIAKKNSLTLQETYSSKKWGEWNFVYKING